MCCNCIIHVFMENKCIQHVICCIYWTIWIPVTAAYPDLTSTWTKRCTLWSTFIIVPFYRWSRGSHTQLLLHARLSRAASTVDANITQACAVTSLHALLMYTPSVYEQVADKACKGYEIGTKEGRNRAQVMGLNHVGFSATLPPCWHVSSLGGLGLTQVSPSHCHSKPTQTVRVDTPFPHDPPGPSGVGEAFQWAGCSSLTNCFNAKARSKKTTAATEQEGDNRRGEERWMKRRWGLKGAFFKWESTAFLFQWMSFWLLDKRTESKHY